MFGIYDVYVWLCRWAAVGPGVAIMFLCASFLPSFAPGAVPSRASQNQVSAGSFEEGVAAGFAAKRTDWMTIALGSPKDKWG